ncbi:short-chain dehydrogenase [Amniculicola lignicola CBS 123094]|uniref:Short-chain dehydrogenase n=1 Tax=Amniculicola lignicola CBS 123094 TaxID=1392246 RepID=A0A6A5W6H2_9PLEO|nr:short-chain dehydrogenase [Amniculicola lignicola CBS 123094]
MAPPFLSFLYKQFFVTPTKPKGSITGKTVIVTGSNVGLGKEAARHYVQLGASSVILAVRSLDKGNVAKQDIDKTTRCGPDVVKVWQLDMASYQSVIAFSERVDRDLKRLDIAMLNAGIAAGKFTIAEKDESDITVNVVSTFLLGLLLLPKLKATAQQHNTRPNLTFVASEVHRFTPFKEKSAPNIFDKLLEETDDMGDRYQVSKMLDVLCTRAMADQKSASQIPVTINCVNPGLCHSELSRDSGLGLTILKFFLARSTEVGSRTLVHAGLQGPESHGQYMSDCAIEQPAPWVLTADGYRVQGKVWGELMVKLEDIKKGVTKNL